MAHIVAWLDRYGVGNWIRGAALLILPLWPLTLDSGFVSTTRWKVAGYAVFLVLLIAGALLERHRNTAAVHNLSLGLRRVNGAFAGTLESLTRKLSRRTGARGRQLLGEAESRELTVPLLARIRELAYIALGESESDLRLRVTLAVPDPDGAVGDLRVWCYDRPYDDARYTKLLAGWAGAPTAFSRRIVETINDLRALELPNVTDRRFRSIVCYPVREHHADHPPLAVVNIDAEPPDFFTPERVERLTTLVQPLVQAVGLVLISRRSDVSFTFG